MELSRFYNKDIVVYGTGETGRRLLSALTKSKDIRLRGVTNSRTNAPPRRHSRKLVFQ